MQGFDASVVSTTSVRDGLMAVLEYKPNKDLRSTVDLYYSKFAQASQGREFQANLMPDWSGNGTPDGPGCWRADLQHQVDQTRGVPVSGGLIGWLIIGCLPPIFYKLMAMKWG